MMWCVCVQYLLFSSSDLIPLDQFVFNTEAHPLKIMQP